MKIISFGGLFHDFNVSYFDTSEPQDILSLEEERFSRQKMARMSSFVSIYDSKALRFILKSKSLELDDVDIIIVSDQNCDQLIKLLPNSVIEKVVKIGHHLSHVGNLLAFLPGELRKAYFFIFDGYGDGLSAITGIYNNGNYEILSEASQKDSLGLIYTAATNHLGFGSFGNEGKMQGLSSYGSYENKYSISKFIEISNLSVSLGEQLSNESEWKQQELYSDVALGYNSFFGSYIDKRFCDEELDIDKHANFAHTIQHDISIAIGSIIDNFLMAVKDDLNSDQKVPILLGGGIGQNSSIINFLSLKYKKRKVHTTTSCSDRGNSLGALQIYLLNQGSSIGIAGHPYLGTSPGNIEHINQDLKLLSKENSIDDSLELISRGEIIATCLGRAEYGSRALGHRSILCSAKISNLSSYLNTHVKHRESFRPFAPIMLADSASKFIDLSSRIEFMTRCYFIPDLLKDSMPEAVHVDSTSRLQTIDSSDESPTSPIIRELVKRLTIQEGIIACINTSFNDAGQPIVNTLLDAKNTLASINVKYLLTEKGLFSHKK